ncbi:MAG: Na-K-Cl cotransporter [Ignavibacteriales bacterium CG12_big_fil_rev_8_21_14_0_65_30_8]|nr:MAG: Na-K-Cl cotransporter [Ignavibacteriales bacterium CG12_big_fil_rev_8_21_14_0_65_30_8]
MELKTFTNKIKNIIPSSGSKETQIKTGVKKFGTFGGVFTPDVLTILGVIMYLRLGWVVGNAGFLGAILIIVLANSVTICTGLSMSSITTNIRIGSGGAFSIIAKSLGLEAGGSIGISLYIAQTLSAALYIIGFTEAWLLVFPSHSVLLVSSTAWILLLGVSYTSAHFAIKIQYVIMTIIGISLVSFLFSPYSITTHAPSFGKFEDGNFWLVFAIFFPAVTGIMAGANMSGDLKNPRKSIPLGTMSSIFVTMIIYIGLAYLLTIVATPEELRSNQMIMVDRSFWGPAVILGIMGATLSSALGSMVGAPRILQALAETKIVPFSKFFSVKTKNNEPRNAIIFSGIIVEICLILGNLNFLAILITMFFLITYGMLNLVVFIQQSMNIISFRPTFKIPKFVPLVGALGCLFMMFLINSVFSIIALIIISILYVTLERRELKTHKGGDIRGGMFIAIAEKATRIAMKLPKNQISWKPDLVVPIDDPNVWAGSLLFIRNIIYPSGSLFVFNVTSKIDEAKKESLETLLEPIKSDSNLFVNHTLIEDRDFLHGAKLVLQTLKAGMFKPNILFLTIGKKSENDKIIKELMKFANSDNDLGLILLRQHPKKAFGMQKTINLWLRDKSPNWNLAILITLQIQRNWEGKINLISVANDKSEIRRINIFLERLSDQARLPSMTELFVLTGSFKETLKTAPLADINILGFSGTSELEFMRNATNITKTSCVFINESGEESAFA